MAEPLTVNSKEGFLVTEERFWPEHLLMEEKYFSREAKRCRLFSWEKKKNLMIIITKYIKSEYLIKINNG